MRGDTLFCFCFCCCTAAASASSFLTAMRASLSLSLSPYFPRSTMEDPLSIYYIYCTGSAPRHKSLTKPNCRTSATLPRPSSCRKGEL